MKTLKNIVICATLLFLASCKGFPDAPLNEALTQESVALSGTWKLKKVTQFDPVAISKGFPDERYIRYNDITANFAGITNYQIAFQAGNYTVTNPNPAVVFGTGGTWSFNDKSADGRRKIVLSGAATNGEVEFGTAYRASDNQLNLYFTRIVGGKAIARYSYEFSK